MRISFWFGLAFILFLIASLGFLAYPNLLELYAAAPFTFWSTIGLVIAGFASLPIGFYDSFLFKEY